MLPIDQRGDSDCLRACIASIFEIAWEEAPDTAPPPGVDLADRSFSQHNVVNDWLTARGLVAWTLDGRQDHVDELQGSGWGRGLLRRGEVVQADGSREPADYMWPYPLATHYVGGGTSPRGVSHSVVMYLGKIAHDPHLARDMTIDRIDSITVYCARLTGTLYWVR